MKSAMMSSVTTVATYQATTWLVFGQWPVCLSAS